MTHAMELLADERAAATWSGRGSCATPAGSARSAGPAGWSAKRRSAWSRPGAVPATFAPGPATPPTDAPALAGRVPPGPGRVPPGRARAPGGRHHLSLPLPAASRDQHDDVTGREGVLNVGRICPQRRV